MPAPPFPAEPEDAAQFARALAALPKAELHLHMEGAMAPGTVVELASRYGDSFDESVVVACYRSRDFIGFLDAYKWVTSYLRTPGDYALVAERLCESLLSQNIVYAEVTLSVGVMLLRRQDAAANFRAIRAATLPFESRGLRLQWIFDVVRQFGAAPAWEVARLAAAFGDQSVVAFGMGGDELALPASEFRSVYEFAAAQALHRLVHAGEIGGPESVRDAVELLGAERIGHGIAAARDLQLVALLAERSIPLEICPTSNLRTGALARQLGASEAALAEHPLPQLVRAGVPVNISTDDPAMFETHLLGEYLALSAMGLTSPEIVRLAEAAFRHAFLPAGEKSRLLDLFAQRARALGLL